MEEMDDAWYEARFELVVCTPQRVDVCVFGYSKVIRATRWGQARSFFIGNKERDSVF